MDNITIERIWQDDDFFEIRCIAQSNLIWATTNVYVADISELAVALKEFPQKVNDEYFWKARNSTDVERDLSFRVIQKDKQGHLLIEVYMNIEDKVGNDDKHNCSFYISTETGVLNSFGQRLFSLNEPIIGTKISLINE